MESMCMCLGLPILLWGSDYGGWKGSPGRGGGLGVGMGDQDSNW